MAIGLRSLALAGALAISASTVGAVTTDPFDPASLNRGDTTSAYAEAGNNEAFNNTELFFSANDSLRADVSITINPYNQGVTTPNTIDVSYSINGGSMTSLAITQVAVTPTKSIGGAGGIFDLAAGDKLSFFLNGNAGSSGNQVTFEVTTAAVPVLPAGMFLLSGLAAMGLKRRKKA